MVGDGGLTQQLLVIFGRLTRLPRFVSKTLQRRGRKADYNFVSNELFIDFLSEAHEELTRKWRGSGAPSVKQRR